MRKHVIFLSASLLFMVSCPLASATPSNTETQGNVLASLQEQQKNKVTLPKQEDVNYSSRIGARIDASSKTKTELVHDSSKEVSPLKEQLLKLLREAHANGEYLDVPESAILALSDEELKALMSNAEIATDIGPESAASTADTTSTAGSTNENPFSSDDEEKSFFQNVKDAVSENGNMAGAIGGMVALGAGAGLFRTKLRSKLLAEETDEERTARLDRLHKGITDASLADVIKNTGCAEQDIGSGLKQRGHMLEADDIDGDNVSFNQLNSRTMTKTSLNDFAKATHDAYQAAIPSMIGELSQCVDADGKADGFTKKDLKEGIRAFSSVGKSMPTHIQDEELSKVAKERALQEEEEIAENMRRYSNHKYKK